MRYLVLSDIHSNLAAFEAVLEDSGPYDRIWCLGDVVGYGPQPNESIELLRSLPHLCVAGNHDWAAVGRIDSSAFNPDALRACRWTENQLTASSRGFIEGLPQTVIEGRFTIVHGSPRYPIWEYISHVGDAQANLAHFDSTFCLFGHTHRPALFRCGGLACDCEDLPWLLHEAMDLGSERLLINPGGVGQPRDGDPRASYAILDLEADQIEFRRVSYSIEATQELMLSEGLPPRLAWRLSVGW